MLVFVINKNGNKLMPCKPAKAKHLLRVNKAKVKSLYPFTIQLQWDCEENVQPITLGIDKGSSYTGICAINKKEILLSGIIKHRTDIKKKMEGRAGNRRQRRNRLWYRPARFSNRASSKKSGRLPPSIKSNVEEVIRVVNKLPLPISTINIEDVQIDIARLNNPNLIGKEYQKSNRLDENLRMACITRDKFTCQNCSKKKVKLEAHHIIERNKGGKDTIKNLLTLCEECHNKFHKGKIKLKVKGVSGFKDRIAQRTMQGKTYMYTELSKKAELNKVFGYQTSRFRKDLKLEKDHDIDAFCIANMFEQFNLRYNKNNFYAISFYPEQTRRQYFDNPKKGKGRVKYQVNKELKGFQKGDIVKIKNKFIRQIKTIYSTGYCAFKYIKGEPSVSSPKKLKLLQKAKTIRFKPLII